MMKIIIEWTPFKRLIPIPMSWPMKVPAAMDIWKHLPFLLMVHRSPKWKRSNTIQRTLSIIRWSLSMIINLCWLTELDLVMEIWNFSLCQMTAVPSRRMLAMNTIPMMASIIVSWWWITITLYWPTQGQTMMGLSEPLITRKPQPLCFLKFHPCK